MKTQRYSFVISLLFLACLAALAGCGKNEAGKPNAEAEKQEVSDASASSQTPESDVYRKPAELEEAVKEHIAAILKQKPELEKAEQPIQMTYFFIRALQTNNENAVNGMLTQDAYNERMKSPQSFACPDFIRDSEVLLGSVQYLSDEKDESKIVGARVGTVWRVKSEEGVTEENIAWVFRFEDDAWLVAGMIAVLDPKYPPILINFEDLEDTQRQFVEHEKEIQRINAEEDANKSADESTDETVETVEEPADEPDEKPADALEDAASEENQTENRESDASADSESNDGKDAAAAENGDENAANPPESEIPETLVP